MVMDEAQRAGVADDAAKRRRGDAARGNTYFLALLALVCVFSGVARAQGREFHGNYDLAPNGVVTVNNTSGNIRVTGWDENRVKVDAIKRGGREEEVEGAQIQVTATRERIDIQTLYPRGRQTNVSVDYDLKVPRGAVLDPLNTGSGNITILGPVARVNAASRSGNLSASDITDAATLNSRSGNVTATRVKGELRAETSSGEVVVEEAGARVYAISRSGGVRAIQVRDDITASAQSGSVRLEKIGGRAVARSMSGGITINDIGGDVQAQTLSDSVTVTNARGHVSANSVSSNVTLRNVTGGARAITVSGSVELTDVKGRIEAGTTSGGVRLTNVESRDLSAKATSGEVRFVGPLFEDGHYEFESFSSNVILILPPDSQFNVSARSHSGSISTDFPVTLGQGTAVSSRGMLTGVVGKGGAEVRAATFSGSVYLKKSNTQQK